MIEKLLIYGELAENELIRDIASYLRSGDQVFRHVILRRIYRDIGVFPDAFERYLESVLLGSENRFSLACEKDPAAALSEPAMRKAVYNDMDIIKRLFSAAGDFNISDGKPGRIATMFIENSAETLAQRFAEIYHRDGCGELFGAGAYVWNNGVRKAESPDPIIFDDLVGYEHHKRRIIGNTSAFIEGRPYNNILLFGDRGTGKSSCVKAAYNMFSDKRLRIMELAKSNIAQIQDVIGFMRNRGFKFILFLDDLSFEETEYEYKELKAHLEGGLESLPANVAVYATSNRFHIVRETNSDNTGITDDIHLNDTIQEKLSLSDRFGITITFDTPTPKEYLNIVKTLLERKNIVPDPEKLRQLAFRWDISNHGRSGRSAVQFVRAAVSAIDEDVTL